MKDRFEAEIRVGDIVWYGTGRDSWYVGKVAKVRANSCTIFEHTFIRNGNIHDRTTSKRSNSQLLVLNHKQISSAVKNYPLNNKDYDEQYKDYLKRKP